MLKNYLKTAFRNLWRNKIHTSISVIGLAVGLAVCFLLMLYVRHELSYDRYHEKVEHIYRLCGPQHPYHAPPAAKLLADNLPEIKDYARILPRDNVIVQYKEKRFKENQIAVADPGLFRIFSFKFKQGNPEQALEQPFSMVISENIARRFFGDENPMGKVITLQNELPVTITGVMEDMPQNSHFRYELITTLTDAGKVFGEDWMNNWGWQNFLVYFQMQDSFSQPDVEKKCSELLKNPAAPPGTPLPEYSLQKLKDIHLYSSRFANDIQPQNSITFVLIFSAIAFLILLIACFNYVNLLTANATTRAKEIGIRKVVGASRRHLAVQFIGESFVVLFMALVISFLLIGIALPEFNSLSGKSFGLAVLLNGTAILEILGIFLITGLLAGIYPAFFLAGIQPAKTLKGFATAGRSKLKFTKLLVGIQFTIVTLLICGALFMFRQIHFLQNKQMGFDKEYTLVTEMNQTFDDAEKFNTLKQALLKENMVRHVSMASRVPSDSLNNEGALMPEGGNEWIQLPFVHVYFDYFETLGINASQGRLFSSRLQTDAEQAVVLNRSALKKLEIQGDPIGQTVACAWPKSNRKIIGIIDDFHFESLYEPIRPAVFVIAPEECSRLMIKVNPSDPGQTVNRLTEICNRFYPGSIFDFQFMDTRLQSIYQKDINSFRLMEYFTALAILIACMGLFGLAIFLMRRRTREIAVRKVLGASIRQILQLLTKDVARWVIIANLVAWPVAWYAVDRWLGNFAYHIDITILPFLLSGIASQAIALLTVGFQAWKAASTDPVKSLKYE